MIATVRRQAPELTGLQQEYPGGLEIEEGVDIVDLATVKSLAERLQFRKLAVLFVNAGIARANELTPLRVEEKDFVAMMLTNALSPMRVVELFHQQVAANGVIALMSSGLASIGNSTGFWELYSSSKAALIC